jgi:hypothetical protein
VNSLITLGLTQLFRGARRGQALTAGLGAVLTLVGVARRRATAEPKLLYARNLEDGQGLTVRLERGVSDGGGS